MLELATDQAEKEGLTVSEVVWVPGAMEVPLALNRIIARDDPYDLPIVGAACLGIIEKGQTTRPCNGSSCFEIDNRLPDILEQTDWFGNNRSRCRTRTH